MPGVIEGLLGLYNVRDAGAKGDGQTNDTPRVHDAILALPLSGGTVVFPPGNYFLGSNVTFQGRTNVTLWLLAGASFSGPGALPANAGTNRVFDMSFVSGSFPPSGPAGGTLSGTYPNPAIAAPPAATTQAFGDAAAAGASGTAADAAHRHGMPGNGSVGTAQLAANAVGTAQLAANAATQSASASGVTANPTTTSATYVDLPDMVITLTTSPRSGGTSELLVWLIANLTSSVVPVVSNIALSLDGAAEAGAFSVTPSVATTDRRQGVTAFRFTGLAAGSHTVKGRWATNTGTATAFSVERQLLVEELKP